VSTKGWVNEKQNNSSWVIKMYCHFQNLTHSNIEDQKLISVNNHMYKSIRAGHYLDHFPISHEEANGVSKESTHADNMRRYIRLQKIAQTII
jgi:hypothetical protein